MKYMYVAASSHEDGKNYAHIIKASESDNLLAILKKYKNLKACNICSSKWKAEDTVSMWNESYKTNGTFGFIVLQKTYMYERIKEILNIPEIKELDSIRDIVPFYGCIDANGVKSDDLIQYRIFNDGRITRIQREKILKR